MLIEPASDLSAFFGERLDRAMRLLGIHPSPNTQSYLIDLLARRAIAPSIETRESLLSQLAQAIQVESPAERFTRLCNTGDRALWSCGFLADRREHLGISRRYVCEVGFRAYRRASRLTTVSTTFEAEVFDELASDFDSFADLLEEVREHTTLRAPQDIIRLYDRYRRLRSPTVASRLHELGVYPQDPPEEIH